MNLWIRTQNKKQLLLINTIALAEDEIGLLLGYGIDGKVKTGLGEYESDERALEILDEIQDCMTIDHTHYEDKHNTCYQECGFYKSDILLIYEMPEE